MSAWWFDADGLSAHYQEPILDFLEAVPGYGDIVRAGRRVARSVGFSPFNRDDPSDWIRQQDRGFAAVKGYHYPSSGNTSRSGNRSLWNSSLGNVSRNWKRSPYRSRRLTKRRNANQWTKRRVRRRIAGRRRVSGGGYRRRKYTGRRRGKYATRSRYRRRRYGVKYRPGRQHLRWKKDIELEEYGRFVLGSADVDQPTQDAQCVSYVSTGPIYAWWPHALKRVMTQSATTIYNESLAARSTQIGATNTAPPYLENHQAPVAIRSHYEYFEVCNMNKGVMVLR